MVHERIPDYHQDTSRVAPAVFAAGGVVRTGKNTGDKIAGATMGTMKRSGFADLPLHGGHVPAWLADRMTKLGTAIAESILYHYGPSELLSRLSDPFWAASWGWTGTRRESPPRCWAL